MMRRQAFRTTLITQTGALLLLHACSLVQCGSACIHSFVNPCQGAGDALRFCICSAILLSLGIGRVCGCKSHP